MCNILGKQRKETVEYRNVRLSINTYDKLDRYVLELMQKRADRRIQVEEVESESNVACRKLRRHATKIRLL
jgi:hypothetical protein